MDSIKVGDKVYVAVANGLREHTVCKVGRKYFYLEDDFQRTKYDINTLEHIDKDYSQNYIKLWRTVEEYENFINQELMLKELRKTLYPDYVYRENPKLPITIYLRICELLDIKSDYKAEVFGNELRKD